MNRNEFIKLMDNVSIKRDENENIYNELEKKCGDQVVSKLVNNSYFSEMIDFAAAALRDEKEILFDFISKDMQFPYKYGSCSVNDYSGLYDLISNANKPY